MTEMAAVRAYFLSHGFDAEIFDRHLAQYFIQRGIELGYSPAYMLAIATNKEHLVPQADRHLGAVEHEA